jgi:hypothetical protein
MKKGDPGMERLATTIRRQLKISGRKIRHEQALFTRLVRRHAVAWAEEELEAACRRGAKHNRKPAGLIFDSRREGAGNADGSSDDDSV